MRSFPVSPCKMGHPRTLQTTRGRSGGNNRECMLICFWLLKSSRIPNWNFNNYSTYELHSPSRILCIVKWTSWYFSYCSFLEHVDGTQVASVVRIIVNSCEFFFTVHQQISSLGCVFSGLNLYYSVIRLLKRTRMLLSCGTPLWILIKVMKLSVKKLTKGKP